MYDVVRFPLDSPDTAQCHLPYDSMQRVDSSEQNLYLTQQYKNRKKSSMLKSSAGVIKSPRRDQVLLVYQHLFVKNNSVVCKHRQNC